MIAVGLLTSTKKEPKNGEGTTKARPFPAPTEPRPTDPLREKLASRRSLAQAVTGPMVSSY